MLSVLATVGCAALTTSTAAGFSFSLRAHSGDVPAAEGEPPPDAPQLPNSDPVLHHAVASAVSMACQHQTSCSVVVHDGAAAFLDAARQGAEGIADRTTIIAVGERPLQEVPDVLRAQLPGLWLTTQAHSGVEFAAEFARLPEYFSLQLLLDPCAPLWRSRVDAPLAAHIRSILSLSEHALLLLPLSEDACPTPDGAAGSGSEPAAAAATWRTAEEWQAVVMRANCSTLRLSAHRVALSEGGHTLALAVRVLSAERVVDHYYHNQVFASVLSSLGISNFQEFYRLRFDGTDTVLLDLKRNTGRAIPLTVRGVNLANLLALGLSDHDRMHFFLRVMAMPIGGDMDLSSLVVVANNVVAIDHGDPLTWGLDGQQLLEFLNSKYSKLIRSLLDCPLLSSSPVNDLRQCRVFASFITASPSHSASRHGMAAVELHADYLALRTDAMVGAAAVYLMVCAAALIGLCAMCRRRAVARVAAAGAAAAAQTAGRARSASGWSSLLLPRKTDHVS